MISLDDRTIDPTTWMTKPSGQPKYLDGRTVWITQISGDQNFDGIRAFPASAYFWHQGLFVPVSCKGENYVLCKQLTLSLYALICSSLLRV